MNKDFRLAFDILDKVFRDGAYSNILLNEIVDKADNKALLTKLVYGVVENNITIEYYISKLVKTKPQKKILTILKLGIYMLKYLDSIPEHAVVYEMVDLCSYANKKEQAGFVNAVLKKCIGYDFVLPTDEKERLSITHSVPLWIVKAYYKQYGKETAVKLIETKPHTLEHIRPNTRKLSVEELGSYLLRKNIECEKSTVGGYFVRNDKEISDLFDKGMITYQSVSSMYVGRACGVQNGYKVLDLCSAPGGKAVYLSELANNVSITACDYYPHRVEQIKDYANRMGVKGLTAEVSDATIKRDDFVSKFDVVLADVPCSGLGVAGKKGDIYLNKTMEGTLELSEIQYQILENAIDYAKPNGVIVYSTCTTLREENFNIVGKTLKFRDDVKLEKMDIGIENDGYIQLLPDGKGMDGFFIARLRKC